MKDIITVDEAARFLHKHPSTIRRWIETKQLKARHLSAGGHGIYVMLRSDLLEVMIAQSVAEKEKIPAKRSVEAPPSNQRALPLRFK